MLKSFQLASYMYMFHGKSHDPSTVNNIFFFCIHIILTLFHTMHTLTGEGSEFRAIIDSGHP